TPDQRSLPMRQLGSFRPGAGVGGAGVHWNGQTWRFLPDDFLIRSHTEERYGAGFIPEDLTIQDWGITYDELESCYDRFEYLCGVSGGGRQRGGRTPAGRKSLRGEPVSRLPAAATGTQRGLADVRQGGPRTGLPPVSRPGRQRLAALQEPAGRADGPMHLLRLLRMVRLRQQFQGLAAVHDPAGAVEEGQLLLPH